MAVEQYKKKVPIFEAFQWANDNASAMTVSEWLGENEWPLLSGEDIGGEPSPSRAKGHYFNSESNNLMIQWPEDVKEVSVGEWIIKNRRYNDLEFMNHEQFSYEYEQYGS